MKRVPSGVGVRLSEAREFLGITARELDRLADKAEGHASLIESGHVQKVSLETASKYAVALGVSVDWLSSGVGDPPTADTAYAAAESAWARHVARQKSEEERVAEAAKMGPALTKMRSRLFGAPGSGELPASEADDAGEHAATGTGGS